jgi:hypothetical protein
MKAAGELFAGFHENRSILLYYQFGLLRVTDFLTLVELSHATFKWPIISVHIIPSDSSQPLQFIVITEDQFAHLLQLNGSQFTVLNSVRFSDAPVISTVLLIDSQSNCHLFFETGNCICVSPNGPPPFQATWPGPRPTDSCFNVLRMRPCPFFEGQHKSRHGF